MGQHDRSNEPIISIGQQKPSILTLTGNANGIANWLARRYVLYERPNHNVVSPNFLMQFWC